MEPTLSVLAPPSPCQYLPDQVWQLRYEIDHALDAQGYMGRLRTGWRRLGPITFRPECPSCTACRSLRIPVSTFQATESQRRALKRNADVEIRINEPSLSMEKEELFAKFHDHGHETKGWPPDHVGMEVFVQNPFRTEEWSYYLGERLIAVGYVDALQEGLSAIYFYWDPAEARRSLGAFNILKMIDETRRRQLPHVYLGYYVKGYRSLEYKARFGPNEILSSKRAWEPFA